MKRYLKQALYKTVKLLGITIKTTDRSVHEFDHTFERLTWMRDQGFKPSEICDIGASNGRWTRKCMKVFPEASYFCVDPLEENQEGLARLKDEQTRFEFWQGCLGPKPGTTILNMNGSGSSILPGHTGNPYGVQQEVPVETLDNFISMGKCPQPDLIKLDVQGYELEVLKGAPQAFSKSQAVIAEISFISFQKGMPVLHEVLGELAEHGYVLYDILSLKLRPLDGTPGQSDLLFLKADHVLRSSNKWDHDSVY